MTHDRRGFLRSTSLAFLAATFIPGATFAADTARKARASRSIPLSPADETVLQWVASYSTNFRIVGASLLGRLRGVQATTRIVAQISDASVLETVFSGPLPFTEMHSAGNVFAFTFQGERYEVENLLPALFTTKFAKLTKKVIFGHEALSFNPVTQKLKDPFNVLSSDTLKIVRAGAGVAGGFENTLRAWVEGDQLGLKLGTSFSRLKKRVLGAPGTRATLAQSVVAALVARLPQLADLLETEKITALLQSRLVRTAITRALGADATSVLAQFEVLRGASGTDADAEAVAWLGSLLSEQMKQGMMPDWFGSLNAADASRARATLSRAYWLVRESSQTISVN